MRRADTHPYRPFSSRYVSLCPIRHQITALNRSEEPGHDVRLGCDLLDAILFMVCLRTMLASATPPSTYFWLMAGSECWDTRQLSLLVVFEARR